MAGTQQPEAGPIQDARKDREEALDREVARRAEQVRKEESDPLTPAREERESPAR